MYPSGERPESRFNGILNSMDKVKKRIFIVEDEPDVVLLLRHLLKGSGYEVSYAYSAEEGLDIWESKQPDLLLLDVMLPKMSGLEFCRKIRQTSEVPILFLSANASQADRSAGYKAGGNGYVMKPFSL